MRRAVWAAAVLALAMEAPRTVAIEREEGVKALGSFKDLKSMDYDTILCDTCLIETECTWPCELACILDLPVDFVGRTCPVCLEFYGCQGCKFLCPFLETSSPSFSPSFEPTMEGTEEPTSVPTTSPSMYPTKSPTTSPTKPPTYHPTSAPTYNPTVSPTSIPTYSPTPLPTPQPSYAPTGSPYPKPTASPSYEPSAVPSAAPYQTPTPKPTHMPTQTPSPAPSATPSALPTPTPEFYLYYTSEGKYLFGYQYLEGQNQLLYEDTYDGDMKCDNVNKMLFWSSNTKGYIKALRLHSDEVYTVIDGIYGVQGLAMDPGLGHLFFVQTGTPAVEMVSYDGGNATVLHTFDDAKVPYGIDVAPEEKNFWGTGTMYVTAYDANAGYIIALSLDGKNSDTLYRTGYNSIYGILVDNKAKMMYWIENRGIANGIYMMYYVENTNSIMFLQDQEEAFWLMAIFDVDLMFTADYQQGFLYQFFIAEDGSIEDTDIIVSVQEPRCIAYFYGLSATDSKGVTSMHKSMAAPPVASVGKSGAKRFAEANSQTPATVSKSADEPASSSSLFEQVPTSAVALVVGMFSGAIVGLAVYFRRLHHHSGYQFIASEESL